MRPKPILSLAMPLGVGVEGEDEICDFSLQQRAPLTELAKKLSRELPQGMELKSVGPCFDRVKVGGQGGILRLPHRARRSLPQDYDGRRRPIQRWPASWC